MFAFFVLMIFLGHTSQTLTQGIPTSPCPKSFQYRFDGQEWFGLVSVRNIEYGEPLHLHIILSMRGKPRTNYLGEIELLTRGKYMIGTPVLYKVKFPKHLVPPTLVQISVNNEVICIGTQDQGVFITQIQLEHTRNYTYLASNAGTEDASDHSRFDDIFFIPKKQKPSAEINDHDQFLFQSNEEQFNSNDFKRFDDIFSIPKKMPSSSTESIKDICGRVDARIRYQVLHAFEAAKVSNEYVTGGDSTGTKSADTMTRSGASKMPIVTTDDWREESSEQTVSRGAWPWMAAIYVNNLTSLAYQCGGTLISSRVLVSSAHCFAMSQRRYTANDILIFLGRQNLKNWSEEGSLAAPCEDIYIHPEYDHQLNSYDADIAVLVLKNRVKFNTFIRPACVWSGPTETEYIVGETGIVVGWSVGGNLSNTDRHASSTALTRSPTVPRVIGAPIVSNEVCFKSNKQFRSLSSRRTFCAGIVESPRIKADNLGPCPGDSGAGLLILKNDQWVLRGIVSATLPTKSEENYNSHCARNQYVIYTDVAQFLDWIMAFTL